MNSPNPTNQPVLFLDVDGVLNRCEGEPLMLVPSLLKNLVRIVEETDCQIVLSSTWRLFQPALQTIRAAFADLGLMIHGQTPDLCVYVDSGIAVAKCRGDEIQKWMDDNFAPDRFVILDDMPDMGHLLPHLMQTDSFQGLTDEITNQAIDALMLSPSTPKTNHEIKERRYRRWM
jgi:hypothetical protein